MTTNKKITELAELSEADLSDDDVLAIVDVSAGTTNKVRKSTLASALAGVASLSATSPVTVSAGTGAVNIAVTTIPITSGGTGATTAADARTNLGVPAATDVVIGPASATDSALALFDGTTGKLIKDSTYTITAAGAALIDDASASAQRTTLGAAASGANTDITSLGGLTTDIAVADGGTGASTASAARTNLGAAASGANTDITSLDSGNIGIGTASASQKLTIQGTDARIYLIGANTDIDMTGTADGQLSLDGNGYGFGIALNSSGANLYTNTTSRDLIFGTDETERMRIEGDGSVKVVNAAYNPITTDNDLSFDQAASNNFKCTPSGTGTLTFTNHTDGQSGNVLLINSGGHAISLAATTKGDANLATTISTAGTYWLSYYDDGTNAYVVTSAVFA